MRLIKIKENRFQLIHERSNSLSKKRQDLESKRFKVETKIRSLTKRKERELNEHKKTHIKVLKETNTKLDIIGKKISPDSSDAYHSIRFKLNPEADKVITGKKFEKELSKFKNIQKNHVRSLMVVRNNYIRSTVIQPKKIRVKYNKLISMEENENNNLWRSIIDTRKDTEPYVRALQITDRNRKKINNNKKKIREINKKYRELEKVKPVWKGMQHTDDYYDKKEKIKDKFMNLDSKKEKLEIEINDLAKKSNKKLFDTKL